MRYEFILTYHYLSLPFVSDYTTILWIMLIIPFKVSYPSR